MAGEMVVVDGVRYRLEDAEARGLIGEKPVAEKAAPAEAPKQPKNKSRRTATK